MTVKPILADTPQPSTRDFEHIGEIAPRWRASLENRTREQRAVDLYREHHREMVLVGTDTFEVPSCTGSGYYLVRYGGDRESCNCPDARRHPEFSCKHVLAVALCFAKRRRPRTYSERVEDARCDAVEEYRREIRAMMAADTLGD